MLDQRSDYISALFCTSCVLYQSLYYPLLDLYTTRALCVCYLDQTFEDAFDGKGFRLSQRQTLSFLGLESYVPCIAVLVVKLL